MKAPVGDRRFYGHKKVNMKYTNMKFQFTNLKLHISTYSFTNKILKYRIHYTLHTLCTLYYIVSVHETDIFSGQISFKVPNRPILRVFNFIPCFSWFSNPAHFKVETLVRAGWCRCLTVRCGQFVIECSDFGKLFHPPGEYLFHPVNGLLIIISHNHH